jgi:serine/threonine protein phosphatase PrpC
VLGQAQGEKMATTLTLGVAVWPWMYTVQVGDSRSYVWTEKKGLHQVTRDQTVAQDLVDRGALPRDSLPKSPLSHVLASAIGGSEAKPVVSRTEIPRGCVVLLCSDGLTKHVSDKEIEQQIGRMESSEQLCRALLVLALDRGGSDNITVLIARARRKS